MLKGIVSLLIFALIFLAVVVLLVIRFLYKGYRSVREAQEDLLNRASGGQRFNRQEYMRYQQQKKEKNPFDADYFKSTDEPKAKTKSGADQQKQENTTTRKTTTSSGVTIIDSRDTDEKRKIFNHDDGEYVEFTEVSD